LKVIRFVNSIFTSNSYILYFEGVSGVWVVDPGDSFPIIHWLENKNKNLIGILITHSHFDHIYGVNDLYDLFPEVKIYSSFYGKEGMLSAKLNSSYYTEHPFVVKSCNINVVAENDRILISENDYANVIYTPGHNRDCLSFQIEKNLFTGDALIPGIKVYTKSKHGNKTLAEKSIQRIFNEFNDDIMLWPGHGDNCLLGSMNLVTS
jgi:hydroxyacylglutathione hydrolase